MLLLKFIFLLFIILIILLLTVSLKIKVIADTSRNDYHVTISWLYPLFRSEVYFLNQKPFMEIFLFRLKIFKKKLVKKKKKKSGFKLLKSIQFNQTNIAAYYGFKDTFTSGIVCGFINFISHFLNVEYFEQVPDFLADRDYIYINATTTIKILPTLKKTLLHS